MWKRGVAMAGIKKPKKAKLPKPAIKEKGTGRKNKKEKKARDKKINRMLGVVAIVICFISSVLDVFINLKNKKKDL